MSIPHTQQMNSLDSFSPGSEEDFGTLIERIRRRSRIQIQEIVTQFPTFLKGWNRFTYSHLVGERKRAILFEELLPLYQALVIAGVHFSAAERNHFLSLGRARIESKSLRNGAQPHSEDEWKSLRTEFAVFDQLPLHDLATPGREGSPSLPPLQEDSRHLVGRDGWVQEMLTALDPPLPKKLVVVQAAMGAGKSSGLHLIRRCLEMRGACRTIFYTCSRPSIMSHEDQLDQLLATILDCLGVKPADEALPLTIPQRIEACLHQLATGTCQIIVFIDNGEVILTESGHISASWQQFLADFVHYRHEATVFLATRAWPLWKGRDRIFIEETRMPPLPPEAGAAIWKQFGFADTPEALLQRASTRCGGNPWLIELRASTLQRAYRPHGLQDREAAGDSPALPTGEHHNERTHLLERFLEESSLFDDEADYETSNMLQEVLSTHLTLPAYVLLETLALSPVPVAFDPLKESLPRFEETLAELQHASLIDDDSRVYAKRIQLLPLVAEATLHRLEAEGRVAAVEGRIPSLYEQWMKQGILSDQEKGAVVAEMIVLALRYHHLLEAAEWVLRYSWLLARFGHAKRLARLAYGVLEDMDWQSTPGQECGGLLLHYHLAPFLGKKSAAQERLQAYLRIYIALLQHEVAFQMPTELYVIHHLMLSYQETLRFREAEDILLQTFNRYPDLEQTQPHRFASLLGRKAALLGAWSEFASERGQHEEAEQRRKQAIAVYRQCIALWQRCEAQAPPAKRSTYRYRRARHLNDLGYYLRKQGQFHEALEIIEQSLDLKMQGYVEPGSLATSYSEKAQCLATLGRFREALHFDQLAVDHIQREAASGNSLLQEDIPVYLVERGLLYTHLGRIDEAEALFQHASNQLSDDRRTHRILAQEAQAEIQRWRQTSPDGKLDWRWAERYAEIVRYDPFHWLSHAGPFTPDEQEEWTRLDGVGEEERRKRLEAIITQSRDREILAAIEEQREPRLRYPCIPIDEVRHKIDELDILAADVERHEPNVIVRRLYLDVIDEHQAYLKMIQATYAGDVQAFWHANRGIHAEPTPREMALVLSHVALLVEQGKQRADTAEVSEQVYQLLRDIHAPLEVRPETHPSRIAARELNQAPSRKPRVVAPQTVKRFFDAVMQEYGFDGWRTVVDATANDPRIEQLTQCLILPEKPLSVERVRTLLSHEIETHVFRAAAGAKSRLELLATGTRGFMATEEGLALYYDRETARVQEKASEDFSPGSLFGTLATGLATGVLTSPLTFSGLYVFLEQFLFLYRTLLGLDKDAQRGHTRSRDLARIRCLRTFRGVPDLTVAGIAYVKDALYLRGDQMITTAVQQDKKTLERLMVGVVGLEQLPDMAELNIVEPPHPPRWLAHDPDLTSYIGSFETEDDRLIG